MNILIVSYYRSMAEYFVDLEDALKLQNPDVQFDHHTLYPCAWIALRKKKRPVSFVRPKRTRSTSTSLSTALEKGITYQAAILGDAARADLGVLAQGYVSYFEHQLSKKKYDGAILVGDSRMAIAAADHVLRRHNVPILYWEQGPFQTTQLNASGVNSNAAFVRTDDAPDAQMSPAITTLKKRSFQRSLSSAIGTKLTEYMSAGRFPTWLVPADRINLIKNRLNAYRGTMPTQATTLPKQAYVYMLQVPYDNQIIEHGGLGRDIVNVLRTLLNDIPAHQLLIRQHPLHSAKYPGEFYDLCNERGLKFADDLPFDHILNTADGVILANSTVGAEAMEKGRKVLILGDAFYAAKGLNFVLDGSTADQETLRQYMQAPVYLERRITYIRNLIAQNFFQGHYLYQAPPAPCMLDLIRNTFASTKTAEHGRIKNA